LLIGATCIKLLFMFSPPYGDLINWGSVADTILNALATGHYGQVTARGVYADLGLLLVPSLWVWTRLPITHPPVNQEYMLFGTSTSVLLLSVLLKLPVLLADIGTGILVSKLVTKATDSASKGRAAFLVWYLNPYNIYWINVFGGMDIIPTFIFMAGLNFGTKGKWLGSGLSLAFAAITRIFPLVTFPFLLTAFRNKTSKAFPFLISFLVPIIVGVGIILVTGAATFTSIVGTPSRQYWLLDFLGYNLTNSYVKLTFVVLALQLFVTYRYWKKASIISLATVSVLALLTAAQAYGGSVQHFIWASPLLTTSMMLNPNEKWAFIFTFVTACLAPFILPVTLPLYADTLTWGAFYAAKSNYLLRINLNHVWPVTTNQTSTLQP
jgi:hypothetical protein